MSPQATRDPVFVVGEARSGTTLLYSVILASGQFPIYRAESRLMECSTRYGRLTRERNFDRFVTDYLQSRQFARSGLDPSVLRQAPEESRTSYAEFLRYFMDAIAERSERTRWVEKSPNHLLFMPELSRAFPDARFVHAIRDGRDVALSQRRLRLDAAPSDNPLVQLIWAAKSWEMMVRMGRRFGGTLGGRYLEVRFEDLTANAEAVIPRLSQFLDIDLSPAAVRESGVGAIAEANTAFGEDIRGISRKPVGRWRDSLNDEEKHVLEWAIGETLTDFGYTVDERPSSSDLRLLARAHAAVGPLALSAKRFLNRHTPVGRYSRRPLEMGLT